MIPMTARSQKGRKSLRNRGHCGHESPRLTQTYPAPDGSVAALTWRAVGCWVVGRCVVGSRIEGGPKGRTWGPWFQWCAPWFRSGEVSSPAPHHDRRLWRQGSGFRTCSSTSGDHVTGSSSLTGSRSLADHFSWSSIVAARSDERAEPGAGRRHRKVAVCLRDVAWSSRRERAVRTV